MFSQRTAGRQYSREKDRWQLHTAVCVTHKQNVSPRSPAQRSSSYDLCTESVETEGDSRWKKSEPRSPSERGFWVSRMELGTGYTDVCSFWQGDELTLLGFVHFSVSVVNVLFGRGPESRYFRFHRPDVSITSAQLCHGA